MFFTFSCSSCRTEIFLSLTTLFLRSSDISRESIPRYSIKTSSATSSSTLSTAIISSSNCDLPHIPSPSFCGQSFVIEFLHTAQSPESNKTTPSSFWGNLQQKGHDKREGKRDGAVYGEAPLRDAPQTALLKAIKAHQIRGILQRFPEIHGTKPPFEGPSGGRSEMPRPPVQLPFKNSSENCSWRPSAKMASFRSAGAAESSPRQRRSIS